MITKRKATLIKKLTDGVTLDELETLSTYRDAKDFFTAVRDASKEAERTRLTILQMQAKEDVRAQTYNKQGRSFAPSGSGMQATDARIDYEQRMKKRIDEDYAIIDLANRVLYGSDTDSRGGVDALLGSITADSINFRYVDALSWQEVAFNLGYSVAQCKRFVSVGFDSIDFLGWYNVMQSQGKAT